DCVSCRVSSVLQTIVQHTFNNSRLHSVSCEHALSYTGHEHVCTVKYITTNFEIPKEAEAPVPEAKLVVPTKSEVRIPVAVYFECRINHRKTSSWVNEDITSIVTRITI